MDLDEYNNLLIEKNKVMNLTGHKTLEKSWEYNILDSLLFLDEIQQYENIVDIGCGAGLPSIPLAIKMPNAKFTLIDSTKKKIDFIKELGVPNVTAIHTRIEDFKGQFDAVLARGLAPLKELVKYARPLLKSGGVLLAYKGQNYLEEVKNIQYKIISKKLNSEITRYLVIVKK